MLRNALPSAMARSMSARRGCRQIVPGLAIGAILAGQHTAAAVTTDQLAAPTAGNRSDRRQAMESFVAR
jgi:hypothetical protein